MVKLPDELRNGARCGTPGFGSACYIDFVDDRSATRAREQLSDAALTWSTFREGAVALRFSGDQDIAVRHRGLFLGELWRAVKQHLVDNAKDLKMELDDIKLGQSRGRLYLLWEGPPRELFATSPADSGGLECTPNFGLLDELKVNRVLADSWVASARAVSSRLSRK